MKFKLKASNQFKRDAKKQFAVLLTADWVEVVHCLINDIALPEKYRDHALKGDKAYYRERHVQPDMLLMYAKYGNVIELARLGSHSELF